MTDQLDNHTLETVAQWHEKNAHQCREIAADDPRTSADARKRAATAAAHHSASAVGVRRMISAQKADRPTKIVQVPAPDTDREIELKRLLSDLQEHYQRVAAPLIDELARIHARKPPRAYYVDSGMAP